MSYVHTYDVMNENLAIDMLINTYIIYSFGLECYIIIEHLMLCVLVLVPGTSPVVSTMPDHRSINVSWVMLECQDRHGNITLYGVRFSSSDFIDSVNQTFNTSSGDETSLEVTGLEEFANYTIEVRAYTAVGPGPYSNRIDVWTLPDSKCVTVYTYGMFVCMCVHACTYICVYMCVHVYVCVCVCTDCVHACVSCVHVTS